MLKLYPVYLLWIRRKTLTGSPDPTHANGTNKPCTVKRSKVPPINVMVTVTQSLGVNRPYGSFTYVLSPSPLKFISVPMLTVRLTDSIGSMAQ